MNAHILAFALLMMLTFGCTNNSVFEKAKYQELKVSELSPDIKIPSEAWDLLEFKKSEHEEVVAKTPIFSEISVSLVQKNDGIIKNGAVKIFLPKGGGTVDLSQFVEDQGGTFYVGFDFADFKDAIEKKVLFVSGARKRKIGGKIFGAGCNQYFDITDSFFKQMKHEGIKVNTTQDRYLSILGGTFLFAAKNSTDIRIAQVTFKNSKTPSLFCKEH